MRNLKLLTHWIAELRDIAMQSGQCHNEGESEPMPISQIKGLFAVWNFEDGFQSGLTPQEAFDKEMEFWLDAE